jgi:serine protease
VKVYGYGAVSGLSLKATSVPSGSSGCTSTTTLNNGVPATGLGSSMGDWSCIYRLTVPVGATAVEFRTSGGSGDADLYVRRENSPTDAVYDCKSAGYSNTETCSVPVTSPGTYYARLYSAATFTGVSLTGTYVMTDGQPGCTSTSSLTYNTPMTGVTAPPGGFSCDYTLSVPTGATNLVFTTTGGSGSTAHLYVKREGAPNLASYDCRANTSGTNNQTCTIASPSAGTWHVRVFNAGGSQTLTNASVRGTYTNGGGNPNPPTGVLTLGQTVSNLSGVKDSLRYWTVNVPTTGKFLTVRTSGGTGDADVYARASVMPDTTTYDCRSMNGGNTETCSAYVTTPGTYYVMMRGYDAYSGVSITATLE